MSDWGDGDLLDDLRNGRMQQPALSRRITAYYPLPSGFRNLTDPTLRIQYAHKGSVRGSVYVHKAT